MNKLAAGIKAIPQAKSYGLSTTVDTPELPERAGALPERLQDIARNYLGARRQSGVSLLEAARWLSEARLEAKHGEWAIFLEAIGLDESRARAQIRIHEEAQRDPLFADRIVNGFLSETVARELLPAPPEVREEVLARETPPTLQDVREAKRAATPVLEPTITRASCIVCAEPGVGTHQLYPQGKWLWLCTTHAPQVAELRRRDWTFTPKENGWLRLTHPDLLYVRNEPTIEKAIAAALELQAGYDYRDQLRATETVAPQPSGQPPITIQTDKGPREITPLRATGVLALHASVSAADQFTITHIASGRRIALYTIRFHADRVFDQLVELDWSQVPPDGGMLGPMALAVARILTSFDDVDQYAARVTRLKELEAQASPAAAPLPPDLVARAKKVGLNVWINTLAGGGYQTGQDKGAANYTTHATLDALTAFIASRETPTFWQSIDAHHPTAHLWTRERPDLLRSACGMTIQNRLPSGSTEAGHCSSCVRATWPQNQAQPDPAHVERVEAQIEADRIPEASMELLDDAALVASIRELAEPLGLQMIWEDGKVILHWPGEDIEMMELLSYGAALEWLKWDAKGVKADREEPRTENQEPTHPDVANRRLSPAAHASALALLISIRTDLITYQIDQAESHIEQLRRTVSGTIDEGR